jgi:adenylate cyclase
MPEPASLRYLFEDCELDTDRRELQRSGSLLSLEPQVFDLLTYLVRHRDRVVSKDDLLQAVWNGRIVSESALTTRINAARTAIGDSGEAQRLIRTLRGRGIRFVGTVREQTGTSSAAEPKPSLPLPDRPSIAVLPFSNMSEDTDQEYFSDGLTEEIITALSKWRWFFVIARNSSFSYKGRQVDVKEIGRELGVHYVLEGSVRRAGQRIRVTAQVVDALTGAHIWAERYDRDLTDVFAIQDEVTQQVASAVEPAMSKAVTEQARKKNPEQMAAWDLYLRGMWHFHQFSEEGSDEALVYFRRALELDPLLADAYVGIARTLFGKRVYRFSGHDYEGAVIAARKALALDPESAGACYILGLSLSHGDDGETALQFARRAVRLNSNFATGHFAVAVASLYMGLTQESLSSVDQAIRLSPSDPQMFSRHALRGSALYLLGRYDEAVQAARQSLGQRWFHTACRVLAASYAQLELMEPARAAMRDLLASDHAEKTIADVIGPFKRSADRDHYGEGLRKAGMPEQ